MQIPNSLQDAWKNVTQDKSISTDDYKTLVKAAGSTDADLDKEKLEFLTSLKSELVKNGIAEKGVVPVGVLSFGKEVEQQAKVEAQPEERKEVAATPQASNEAEVETEAPKVEAKRPEPQVQQAEAPRGLLRGSPLNFSLPEPELPKADGNKKWTGYNQTVNSQFTEAFNLKQAPAGKVPVMANQQAANVYQAFGSGSIEQFQQLVGSKQDKKFGPETHFQTKNYVANEINKTQTIEGMGKISGLLGVMGNDPEVDQLKSVLSERMSITQNFIDNRETLKGYVNNINAIVASADPDSMDSLVNAKGKLQGEFNKLGSQLQALPQVKEAHGQAMGMVDEAIGILQGKLDAENQNIKNMKKQLVGDINGILDKSIMAGLTTGDVGKIKEGKTEVEAAVQKYPKIKDMPDVQAVKNKALDTLSSVESKINQINALLGKKDWSKADEQSAKDLLNELPPGPFKDKLAAAIESHSAEGKLKEKNKSNLPTTREGLHDVIGNGFWNLENKEGTKALFQLVAKQGLLNEAIVKMTPDDQVEAIKVMTKDIKLDKPLNEDDKFSVSIARSIYTNLNAHANYDKEFKGSLVSMLKKEAAPENFSAFNIGTKNYVEGMKFSIGSDRIGSEKEAALTMARGIMNGEVGKESLGQLNRYELSDLTKFVEKKGSTDEKNQLLKTVAHAYNEGVAVNIESLDKKDKAVVVKSVLDIPNVSETKISDLLSKAGKKTVFETVKNQNVSDRQLSIIGKHVNGDDMADNPQAGAKILVGMIKTYNKQEEDSPVSIGDIRKYINQVDKDWWQDDDTMKTVIDGLGDGPKSEYAKFQHLAPATLDKIWSIAR